MTAVRTIRYVRPHLYPAQHEALFCEERYSWIEASTKSGKTHGAIVWLHEQAVLNGGVNRNFWWVAPIYAQSKIAFRRLINALPKGTFTRNESELTIKLANGSVIWFKGGDNPDSLYGEDVYAAVIDEASRVKAEAWFAVRSTLTATQGPVRIIGNVKGKRNWFFRGSRKAESGLDGHRFFRLSAYDAAKGGVIPTSEIEDARRTLPESTFRELYLALPADDGDAFFATERISIVEAAPPHVRKARGWDFASSEAKAGKDPDWTAGVLLGLADDHVYVMDVERRRSAPDGVLAAVVGCATKDGPAAEVVIEEERGAAGKVMVESIRQTLRNVPQTGRVHNAPVSGDKATRAFGLATMVNASKVSLVRGGWNDIFLSELDEFPSETAHDDQVDAAAHAYNFLRPSKGARVRFIG